MQTIFLTFKIHRDWSDEFLHLGVNCRVNWLGFRAIIVDMAAGFSKVTKVRVFIGFCVTKTTIITTTKTLKTDVI